MHHYAQPTTSSEAICEHIEAQSDRKLLEARMQVVTWRSHDTTKVCLTSTLNKSLK